jgi:hypothetical protein
MTTIGTERPLATVHRLRPRTASRWSPARRTSDPAPRGESNLIDLARARSRRRAHLNFDSPPEGTAA